MSEQPSQDGSPATPGTPGTEPGRRRPLLITGFGPFLTVTDNPSARLAEALADPADGVEAMVLPVSYSRAPNLLAEAIADLDPAGWIGLGVAGHADGLRLETLARNRLSSEHADVDGAVGKGRDVDAGGPPALPTRLPLFDMRRRLRRGGHAHSVSDDAGGYVCNALFYAGLRALPVGRPGGFIHIPHVDRAGFNALRAAMADAIAAINY